MDLPPPRPPSSSGYRASDAWNFRCTGWGRVEAADVDISWGGPGHAASGSRSDRPVTTPAPRSRESRPCPQSLRGPHASRDVAFKGSLKRPQCDGIAIGCTWPDLQFFPDILGQLLFGNMGVAVRDRLHARPARRVAALPGFPRYEPLVFGLRLAIECFFQC